MDVMPWHEPEGYHVEWVQSGPQPVVPESDAVLAARRGHSDRAPHRSPIGGRGLQIFDELSLNTAAHRPCCAWLFQINEQGGRVLNLHPAPAGS